MAKRKKKPRTEIALRDSGLPSDPSLLGDIRELITAAREHKGFKTFLLFMNWFKPKYLIHGHVHLYDRNETRHSRYRSTEVVNAYDHVIIDTEDQDG